MDSAGIGECLDEVISVEDLQIYKPSRAVYDMVGERLDVAPMTETLKWGQPAYVPPRSTGTTLRLALQGGEAAIVVTENKVVAVLSQIDLIDYLAKRSGADRPASQPVG